MKIQRRIFSYFESTSNKSKNTDQIIDEANQAFSYNMKMFKDLKVTWLLF